MKKIIIFLMITLKCFSMNSLENYKEIKETGYFINDNGLKTKEIEIIYKYNESGKLIRKTNILEKIETNYKYEEKKEEISTIKPTEEILIKKIYNKKNMLATEIRYLNKKEIEKKIYKYNSKDELIEEIVVENGLMTEKNNYKTYIDSKMKNKVNTEDIVVYDNKKNSNYISWRIETIYDENNLKVKESYSGNKVSEVYYEYNKDKKLIKELNVGATGNVITYYEYYGNLLKEKKEYEYIEDLWSESDYKFPNVPESEPKKLRKIVIYDYQFFNKDEKTINCEKFQEILRKYNINKEMTIEELENAGIKEILREKPTSFTDGQYISILNDYAYFLSETERYKEAIPILERIIVLTPNRVVAYLNLGDCYYKEYKKYNRESDKMKVIENYKKYLSLLKKDAKIPERVKEMIK